MMALEDNFPMFSEKEITKKTRLLKGLNLSKPISFKSKTSNNKGNQSFIKLFIFKII